MSNDMDPAAFLAELRRWVGSGVVIALEYAAGTAPGQSQDVIINAVNKQKVAAHASENDERRTFFTSKILAFTPSGAARIVNPRKPTIDVTDIRLLPELDSLEAYFPLLVDAFQGAGWKVETSPTSIMLFARFKNGKPRRTPAAAIVFQPTLVDTVFDDEAGDVVEVPHIATKHDRPWHAWWPGGATTRAHVADIAQRFYAEMIGQAPDNPPQPLP